MRSRVLVIGIREKEREEKEEKEEKEREEEEEEEKNLQIPIRCLWDLFDWLWLGWSLTRNSQIQKARWLG